MAKKIRKTEEEEIVKILKREGFKELAEKEIKNEPYKTLYSIPDCFKSKTKKSNA